MRIYYLQKDQQFLGPFSLDEMREQAIAAQDMIWKDGTPDWVPAITLEELACMFRPQGLKGPGNYTSAGNGFSGKPLSGWLTQLTVFSRLWTNEVVRKQYA